MLVCPQKEPCLHVRSLRLRMSTHWWHVCVYVEDVSLSVVPSPWSTCTHVPTDIRMYARTHIHMYALIAHVYALVARMRACGGRELERCAKPVVYMHTLTHRHSYARTYAYTYAHIGNELVCVAKPFSPWGTFICICTDIIRTCVYTYVCILYPAALT
jgi:hypothetical protein